MSALLAPEVGRFSPLADAPGGVLGDADADGRLAPGLALAVRASDQRTTHRPAVILLEAAEP